MSFRAVSTHEILNAHWIKKGGSYSTVWYATHERLNRDDTYLAIFSLSQGDAMKFFEECGKYKILYKSPAAVNGREGHGSAPRNTLFIFELADGKSKKK